MKHFYKYAFVIMILIAAILINKMSCNSTKQSFELEKVNLGKQIYLTSPHNVKVERVIDVVLSTDDNYSPHCATVMASILLNSDATSAFRFHILDGGISAKNKAKIRQLQSLRPCDINFYDMTKYDLHEMPSNISRLSVATYYRLLITEVLPKYVDKAIYLDCDIIVEQDLKLLWEEDLSGKILGVVKDDGTNTEGTKRLGLPGNYFNAGVLVIDMKKLRNINLKEKSLSYLRSNKTIITLQDQDILNGLFYDQCKYLPLNWNCQTSIYHYIDPPKYYHPSEENEIVKYNPAIIHFTGGGKPWRVTCVHPLKKEYDKYSAYTAFKPKEYPRSLMGFLKYVYVKTMLWIIY